MDDGEAQKQDTLNYIVDRVIESFPLTDGVYSKTSVENVLRELKWNDNPANRELVLEALQMADAKAADHEPGIQIENQEQASDFLKNLGIRPRKRK